MATYKYCPFGGGPLKRVIIDYKDRLSRLQLMIQQEGWDAYVATRQATLSWLLGTFAPWRTAVIVPAFGDPVALFWRLDATRLKEESSWTWNTVVWGNDHNFAETIANQLKLLNVSEGKIGLDLGSPVTQQLAPGLLLSAEYLELQHKLPEAQWTNAVPAIEALLAVKEEEEIQLLRKAAQIADIGMEAARDALEPGITENAVAGVVEKAIRLAGSEWSWADTLGTEVGSGLRTAYYQGVTQPATEKRIEKGDLVIVDLHPMYQLYLADLAGNFYIGSHPPEEIRKLADAWERTVDRLLHEIKPGRVIHDVVQNSFQVIVDHGFEQWGIRAFGHGLGTDARIEPYLVPENTSIFKENMVMALGTHLYIPGLGGMRLELPTLVTSSGAEPLCQWEPILHTTHL